MSVLFGRHSWEGQNGWRVWAMQKERGGTTYDVRMTASVLLDPGPWAFMILDLSTSAGEHTVVATVPW